MKPATIGPDNARRAVRAAILKGHLVRPDRCERCQKVGKPEAHHPDYSKPLAVAWLCLKCHRAEHRAGRDKVPSHRDVRAQMEPATPLARWMKSNGKTISDLCRAVTITHPTARTYVDGHKSKTIDWDVSERISRWTAGAVPALIVAAARAPSLVDGLSLPLPTEAA